MDDKSVSNSGAGGFKQFAEEMTEKQVEHLGKAGIAFVITILIMTFFGAIIASVFTLIAVNTLFNLSVPITFGTVLSLAWLIFLVKKVLVGNLTEKS